MLNCDILIVLNSFDNDKIVADWLSNYVKVFFNLKKFNNL